MTELTCILKIEKGYDIMKKEKSKILVIGLGTGGAEIVDKIGQKCNFFKEVDYLCVNSDKKSLALKNTNIFLWDFGIELYFPKEKYKRLFQKVMKFFVYRKRCLGCGGNWHIGEQISLEHTDTIKNLIKDKEEIIIISCFGGGFGTGASTVFAQIAKKLGIKTSAIITIPFYFDGKRKEAVAKNGLDELKKYIEKIDIVDGQNILVPENFKMTYYEALQKKTSEVEKIFVKKFIGVK